LETSLFSQVHRDCSFQGHARPIFGDDTLLLQPAILNKQCESILVQLQDLMLAVTNVEGSWPQARTMPVSRLNVTQTPRDSGSMMVSGPGISSPAW